MEYKSYAKINLFLDIISKLKNGYHGIVSLFSEIDLYDLIIFEKNNIGKIRIFDKNNILPEDNLLKKAADRFINFVNKIPYGIDFHIDKKVPIGGGLGGGSSNAASVLKILNNEWKINLSDSTMEKIGSKIGSDVPFFIKGGLQEVYGTGNKLKKVKSDFCDINLIIIIPEIGVSTKLAYDMIDNTGLARRKKINKMKYFNIIKGFKDSNFELIINNIYNKFEKVIFNEYPMLNDIKNDILQTNAVISFMSGSGSTILGIYKTNPDLKSGIEQLSKKGYNCMSVRLKFK